MNMGGVGKLLQSMESVRAGGRKWREEKLGRAKGREWRGEQAG